uniref:Uncharacterized protein n=1 Tax=Zea mays TaxID=4577 RepID=C0PM20_MAIZE|nr:unknown [Zea mays]
MSESSTLYFVTWESKLLLQLSKSSLSPRSLPRSSDCDSLNSEIFSSTGSSSSFL